GNPASRIMFRKRRLDSARWFTHVRLRNSPVMRGSGTLPARNSCLFTGENAAFVELFLRELKDADCFLRILCVSTSPPYVCQPDSFDMCDNPETRIAMIRPLQFRV